MPQTHLSEVEINPAGTPKATVIWLHGLGADGYDFASVIPRLNLAANAGIRFVFPHAPIRPITVNNGYHMRGWYDITGFDLSSREDEAGLNESRQTVIKLIQKENAAGIPSNKIILAGFSQGGAVAFHAGLRHAEKLAGILALSTYLPLASTIAKERSPANQQTPIFLAHGTEDSIIPLSWAEMARAQLTQMQYPISWHTYPIDHSVSLEEIADIGAWLTKVLE